MLDRIYRALKPGGRLVIVDYSATQTRNLAREVQARRHVPAPDLATEEIRQAGFTIERLDESFLPRKPEAKNATPAQIALAWVLAQKPWIAPIPNWDINVLPLNISSDRTQLMNIRNSYQNFRPYRQFGAIQHYSNYGHNSYHGVTIRVDKRYSSGFTVNSFWTFSKAINDVDDDGGASGITWYNRRLEKARASYDIHHRWVSTLTYELPFGRGKR